MSSTNEQTLQSGDRAWQKDQGDAQVAGSNSQKLYKYPP